MKTNNNVNVNITIDRPLFESVIQIEIKRRGGRGIKGGDTDIFSEFVHSACHKLIADKIDELCGYSEQPTKTTKQPTTK